jgi:hypothetical protein
MTSQENSLREALVLLMIVAVTVVAAISLGIIIGLSLPFGH